MLITKADAHKLDYILDYLVKNETTRVKLKQIMDLMNVSLEEARYLYESILKYHREVEEIISIHHAENIAYKPVITKTFLAKGGFMAVYKQQEEVKAYGNQNLSVSTIKKSDKSLKAIILWIALGLSIAAMIISLLSLLISLKIIKTE